MAMRPPRRGSILRPPPMSMRSNYESFRPRYEWKFEDEASLLLLYLPGFLKEQIRTEVDESKGLIHIQGQRLLGTGRRSVFKQSFMIPSPCDSTQVKTQFELGVFTIIMPTKSSLTSQKVDAQPKTTPQQQQLPTTAPTPTPQDQKVAETTTSKEITDAKKQQLDHHQERVEPIDDDYDDDDDDDDDDDKKLADATKEKSTHEAISPDHEKLKKVDGKKGADKDQAKVIPDEKLPKAEKDQMMKKGDAEEKVKAKNIIEHKSDLKRETMKSDQEQACIINMVIAALVLMGLGAHIFSIVGSSKTA